MNYYSAGVRVIWEKSFSFLLSWALVAVYRAFYGGSAWQVRMLYSSNSTVVKAAAAASAVRCHCCFTIDRFGFAGAATYELPVRSRNIIYATEQVQ